MKIMISADMEGLAGVVDWKYVSAGNSEYTRFREIMTAEVNAAVRGAFAGGADEVLVSDAHGSKTNILIEKLDERAKLNSGSTSPFAMMQGYDSGIDAAMFVGYHARSGAQAAILAHTVSGRISNVWLNGRVCGEFGMNAALFGSVNVPVILVSSDLAGCQEAEEWVPGIEQAVIKTSSGRYAAECLSPKQAQKLLEECASNAVKAFKAGKAPAPIMAKSPVKMRVEFLSETQADSSARMPSAERVDGRTIEIVSPDMPTAYLAFRAAVALGNAAPYP